MQTAVILITMLVAYVAADNNHWIPDWAGKDLSARIKKGHEANLTSQASYTYKISSHHFSGTGYDGSSISTSNACSGAKGSCRDNPSCECEKSVGPLPEGHYTLGDMFTFHGMPYCYELFPDSSNNMCGRSGFLIHGGGCSADPSEGCIVIESEDTRYKIQSGGRLTVTR